MALVAYDTNSDSDISEDEEETNIKADAPQVSLKTAEINGHISDEEDFFGDHNGEGLHEEEQEDLISLISKKLPNAKFKSQGKEKSFVDVNEDNTTIPAKKDYGEKLEEPPAKKKKQSGPVKISIPALVDLKEDEDVKETAKIQPSKTGSGLFSILPPPKNKFVKENRSGVMKSSPSAPVTSNSSNQNLKPQGVRTVGLIPHRVANPVKPAAKPKPAVNSDDDSDDDYLGVNSGSYFPSNTSLTNSKYKKVNPNPHSSGSRPDVSINPTPPSLPSDNNYVSLDASNDMAFADLGPAVAPYPPPAPTYTASSSDDLVDNEEAILRLAGKQNKLREMKDDGANGGLNIVDIHGDDMKGDPRVWLTKALTEEKAPRPTGKGPKGLAKTRHQITYLAHQAKERDWELKQEWATARENRMASRNKYGFC